MKTFHFRFETHETQIAAWLYLNHHFLCAQIQGRQVVISFLNAVSILED